MLGNVQRHWSEIVILLGPKECQLGEHLLDLSKLPDIPVTRIDFKGVKKG